MKRKVSLERLIRLFPGLDKEAIRCLISVTEQFRKFVILCPPRCVLCGKDPPLRGIGAWDRGDGSRVIIYFFCGECGREFEAMSNKDRTEVVGRFIEPKIGLMSKTIPYVKIMDDEYLEL